MVRDGLSYIGDDLRQCFRGIDDATVFKPAYLLQIGVPLSRGFQVPAAGTPAGIDITPLPGHRTRTRLVRPILWGYGLNTGTRTQAPNPAYLSYPLKDGENGRIVDPLYGENLAEALNEVMRSYEVARSLGTGRHTEDRTYLRPERTAERFAAIYRELAG